MTAAGLVVLVLVAGAAQASAGAALNFSVVYEWFKLDYAWSTDAAKATALSLGRYVPEHNAPGGLAVLGSRVFVSVPRWLSGVPSTLNWLPSAGAASASPRLNPFPSWEMQVRRNPDFFTVFPRRKIFFNGSWQSIGKTREKNS